MKKYKLLKDLPGIESGTIITRRDGKWRLNKSENPVSDYDTLSLDIVSTNYSSLWLEEIKEAENFAQNGMLIFDDISKSNVKIEVECYFNNINNANKFTNKMQALQSIRKRKTENDGDFVPDWENEDEVKYNVYYKYNVGTFASYSSSSCKDTPLLPHFSSQDICKKLIEECEKDLLCYFGIHE